MFDFWLAVTVVLIFSSGYIIFSIARDNALTQQKTINKSGKLFVFLPLIFLVVSPIYYWFSDSYQKQLHWQEVNKEIKSLINSSNPVDLDSEMAMQDLMLGLRTQTFEDPNNGRAWFLLGQSYNTLNMNDLALAAVQRAIRVENNPDWVVFAARLMASDKTEASLKQAANILEKTIYVHSDHQMALLTLGFTYYNLADYAKAVAIWEKLASISRVTGESRKYLLEQIEKAKSLINQ